MKIAIYIVTYNNDSMLNRCLSSIQEAMKSISPDIKINVNVINNYGNTLKIHDGVTIPINVLNNVVRPDFATGHLSRNWNQAIINGIKNIKTPDNDIVVLAQNDSIFGPHFFKHAVELVKKYDYITLGRGDEVQIITPNAINKVGLYDERFCNIGYQEADYFLRAKLILDERASINDSYHGRVWNPLDCVFEIIKDTPNGFSRGDTFHRLSFVHHNISSGIFAHKWGDNKYTEQWSEHVLNKEKILNIPKQYIMYPYFETLLKNLDDKYIIH